MYCEIADLPLALNFEFLKKVMRYSTFVWFELKFIYSFFGVIVNLSISLTHYMLHLVAFHSVT